MTLGVGGILASEPADIVRRLTFATKEAAGADHGDLFDAMARVNLAHAVMLHRGSLVSPVVGKQLVELMLKILEGGSRTVPLKAADGDLYPQIEAFAAGRLGGDAAGFLQLGRSRGDVIPAAMRIKLRTKELRVLASLLDLRGAVLERAREQMRALMPAYTHWQQSQVMTMGHFLGRFAAWFARDFSRLWDCLIRHDLSPLGAANGVGTSVRLDRDMTADLLGHRGPVPLAGDAVYAWDYMIEPVMCSALFTSNAARLMGNFILWHTREFGMVRLSDAFATASTYLPQKRNPEPLESVKAFAEMVQGDLATVFLMARNEDWPHSLINHGYPTINRALDLGVDAAVLSTAILGDIQFIPERMRGHLDGSFVTASEVANTLVVKTGMSFREAHEVVGLAARNCIASRETQLVPSRIREAGKSLGHANLGITDDDLRASIEPEEFVRRMVSPGGVDPATFEVVLLGMERELATDRGTFAAEQARLAGADAKLIAAARRILSE
ncbi:MAG: argininosuccinate lyase [Betaproteobacteria bacterium]|nr:argininosuccinate lyase [Betaproteobacteria bacterium]